MIPFTRGLYFLGLELIILVGAFCSKKGLILSEASFLSDLTLNGSLFERHSVCSRRHLGMRAQQSKGGGFEPGRAQMFANLDVILAR